MDAPEVSGDVSKGAPAVAKRDVRSLYKGTPPKPVGCLARGDEFGRSKTRLFIQESAESTDSTNSRYTFEILLQ